MINYDLAEYKMELQPDFSIDKFLEGSKLASVQSLADSLLVEFTGKVASEVKHLLQ